MIVTPEAIHNHVNAIDKNLRIGMQDLAAQFDNQFALPRFNFALFCSLAVIALILGLIGWAVGRRTPG